MLSPNKIFYIVFGLIFSANAQQSMDAPFLSNLKADKDDPLYTTYAALIQRSSYKIDQGYQLSWFDPEEGINFVSANGGHLCIAYKMNGVVRSRLREFYTEPVITASYNDLVRFRFYPFKDLLVEGTYVVYSAGTAIQEWKITNQTNAEKTIELIPYYKSFSAITQELQYNKSLSAFIFKSHKGRDGWMKDHDIPYAEDLINLYRISESPDNYAFTAHEKVFGQWMMQQDSFNVSDTVCPRFIAFQRKIQLQIGASKTLRIIRSLDIPDNDIDPLIVNSDMLFRINLNRIINENEKIYSGIPVLKFSDPDYEMLYWNAFTLIRQCMMQPEGECRNNYYVFSREPKWGWGYGGQVFHESLVMLAYGFMDPVSAMNSQRVYINRQTKEGYINYRTGPYLNEQIEFNGGVTSSAPWYNYQNYELFKITGDRKFLAEAYASGKKFYEYFTVNRDSNGNGLCEWGAHAELESVRDARVAVWDKVGWPANFEGPDINSMLVMEAKSLAAMADSLGYSEEAKHWKQDASIRSELINRFLWDEETGFYYNVNKSDQSFTFKKPDDLKIKEIIGFLPLWAGVCSKNRADYLLKSLKNSDEFWRSYGISSLSAKDDYYNPIGYWNGPVWVQWQYLIFRGLLDYGYNEEAKELAYKVMDNVIWHLKQDHVFWEFYSADDHQAGWNHSYIWTGIVARFLTDLSALELKSDK
jgi:hypothetical protein